MIEKINRLINTPMNASSTGISACRHCRHYTPEGRRGGHCNQFSSLVQGHWTACCLGVPPFAPSWEDISEAIAYGASLNLLKRSSYDNNLTDPMHSIGIPVTAEANYSRDYGAMSAELEVSRV